MGSTRAMASEDPGKGDPSQVSPGALDLGGKWEDEGVWEEEQAGTTSCPLQHSHAFLGLRNVAVSV